jgi:hypothetical protein
MMLQIAKDLLAAQPRNTMDDRLMGKEHRPEDGEDSA